MLWSGTHIAVLHLYAWIHILSDVTLGVYDDWDVHANLFNLGNIWIYGELIQTWKQPVLEVYEDDVDRNYGLILEVLIALRETLRMDGLPHVKDFQAIWLYGIQMMTTVNPDLHEQVLS